MPIGRRIARKATRLRQRVATRKRVSRRPRVLPEKVPSFATWVKPISGVAISKQEFKVLRKAYKGLLPMMRKRAAERSVKATKRGVKMIRRVVTGRRRRRR